MGEPSFTDFSTDALATRFLPWAEAYLQLCVDGWANEVAARYGAEAMADIEWTAWNDQVVPELERMRQEFLPADVTYDDPNQQVPEAERATTRVRYTGLFSPRLDAAQRSKPELVTWLLGSHEYLLQCIEAWATQITVRHSLDDILLEMRRNFGVLRYPVTLLSPLIVRILSNRSPHRKARYAAALRS